MEKERWSRTILRLAGKIALVDLVIVILVAVVGLLAGWTTARNFGTALVYGGVFSVAVGVYSVIGGWGLTRDASVLWARSTSQQNMHERTSQDMRDIGLSYERQIMWLVAGLVAILAGSLIKSL